MPRQSARSPGPALRALVVDGVHAAQVELEERPHGFGVLGGEVPAPRRGGRAGRAAVPRVGHRLVPELLGFTRQGRPNGNGVAVPVPEDAEGRGSAPRRGS